LAQHYLARAAAQDYRAVLVGDAADETHYGYNFTLSSACGGQITDFLTQLGRAPLAPQMEVGALRLTARYEDLVAEAGLAGGSPVDRQRGIAHLLVQRWLPRLLHNGDIHTMAHSLEARVPFADLSLLDLAVKVHPDLATREGTGKFLLRRAARGLMPETARLRRKSSLPKDDACAQIYQREAGKALNASEGLLGTWLNTSSLRAICAPTHVLTESERALLFRVICFHHWAEAYQLQTP
jgi:asparagine synthase (glutamine-hydrolysing)